MGTAAGNERRTWTGAKPKARAWVVRSLLEQIHSKRFRFE
jgi:hypothetical protein